MKAHTGMKRNQDVKVSILLYLIVKLNIIIDIHTMYNNSFHIKIFFYLECPLGYYDSNCSKACSFPLYGKDCQSQCNCNYRLCDHKLGCTKYKGMLRNKFSLQLSKAM